MCTVMEPPPQSGPPNSSWPIVVKSLPIVLVHYYGLPSLASHINGIMEYTAFKVGFFHLASRYWALPMLLLASVPYSFSLLRIHSLCLFSYNINCFPTLPLTVTQIISRFGLLQLNLLETFPFRSWGGHMFSLSWVNTYKRTCLVLW